MPAASPPRAGPASPRTSAARAAAARRRPSPARHAPRVRPASGRGRGARAGRAQARLGAAPTAPLPLAGRCAWRARPDPLPASGRAGSPGRAHALVTAPSPRPGLWSPGPLCRASDSETRGAPTCPRYPAGDLPRAAPPVVSCLRALPPSGRLPSGPWTPSACPALAPGGRASRPRRSAWRGAITRPASSCHPAPYAQRWGCTWRSLRTCWRGLHQVGLALALAPTGAQQPIA
jgi:hypothetical protein